MDFHKKEFKNQQRNGNGSMEEDKSYSENHLEKEMNIDYDIIHLKDHLNASFIKDNIVVSEELIQKTLQAIQSGKSPLTAENDYQEENGKAVYEDDKSEYDNDHQEENGKVKYKDDKIDYENNCQEENDKIEYENDKKNRSSIFRLASIAAVLLLLLVGLNVFKYLQFGNKKDMAAKQEIAYDTTESSMANTEESVPESKALEKDDKTKEANVNSIAADKAAREVPEENPGISSYKSTDESSLKDGKNAKSETLEPKMEALPEGNIFFSDILPFTADQVTSFTIINSKEEAKSFKDPEKTKEFLLLLNDYPLLLIENEEDTMEDSLDYQIKFTTKDNISYTILVGNEIQLKTDDNNNDIIRYSIMGNVDQFKSRLGEYK